MSDGSVKLFRITEPDLCELERVIPQICMDMMEHLSPRTRTQFERLKRILSDIRWEGGPPRDVQATPAGDPNE